MKQENKQPLYKALNEQRTQGELKIEEKPFWGNRLRFNTGNDLNLTTVFVIEDYTDNKEQAAANAQYTALAVNNLHHLAEALDNLHKAAMQIGVTEWWQKHRETVAQAKETLNRIS